MRVMHRHGLERLTIRAALVLGFSLTLGLWLFTGYSLGRRLDTLQTEAASINARYVRAQDQLSTVRAQVLLGSIYLRDALLSSPEIDAASLVRLEETSATLDSTLDQYVPVLGTPAERDRIERLRREVHEFKTTLDDVLSSGEYGWQDGAQELLNERVITRRQVVIQVSEDVQALNRQVFIGQQSRLASVYDGAERRTWIRLGLALAASLGIALLATIHAGRLERRLEQQRETERANAEDLQRLSAKLITVQEEERRIIARELHDEVGQVLTAIKMELAVSQRRLEAAGIHERSLEDAQAIADGALHAVRDLSHLLHPSLLDDLGLSAAVDAYIKGFRRRHDTAVTLNVRGLERRLPQGVEAAAYRVVQEALTNVARHAAARHATVTLAAEDRALVVSIEDDGRGLTPREANHGGPHRGLGLIGMRERVTQLGGTLAIESRPTGGARIRARIPVSSVDAESTVGSPAA